MLPSLKILAVETADYKNATLKILNIGGRMMLTRKLKMPRTFIDLASYSNGIYFAIIVPVKRDTPEKIILF